MMQVDSNTESNLSFSNLSYKQRLQLEIISIDDDLKKLERLEKLARKIRGTAGGSDGDKELPDAPGVIGGALSRLAKLSGDLKKSVSKTSRFVISAAVIERSNELIELIRHIRSIKKP